MKTIKGALPAILTDEKDYADLLEQASIKYLKDANGHAVFAFAGLVDGMTYTAGPRRVEDQGQF